MQYPPISNYAASLADQPLLILWDIDGTLVWRAAEAHAKAVIAATREVHGPIEIAVGDVAGRTDRAIVRMMLRAGGINDGLIDAGMDRLLRLAADHYTRSGPADLSHTVLPGMPELLASFTGDPQVRQGLVTGNIEAVAHRKLTAAGLAGPLQPWVGAYGSDHEDRNELVPIAQQRASDLHGLSERWPGHATVIVGDTPHDIACARAGGAHAIAVTTGAYGREALIGADAIVDDAAELARALDALRIRP